MIILDKEWQLLSIGLNVLEKRIINGREGMNFAVVSGLLYALDRDPRNALHVWYGERGQNLGWNGPVVLSLSHF